MDRRTDGDARTRIGAIERKYDNFSQRVLRILLVMTIGLFILGGLSVWLASQRDAQETHIRNLVFRLQDDELSRCKDQNVRHNNTINALHLLANQNKLLFPERAKQIAQSVKQNILIINALAPKAKCKSIVK